MRSPPMDPEMLEDFVAQIKSSRENALAGKYEDALVFYDGVLAQIQHRMKSELDAEMQRKWSAARESITCESQHVKELAQVIAQFREVRPGAAAAATAAAGKPVAARRPGTIAASNLVASSQERFAAETGGGPGVSDSGYWKQALRQDAPHAPDMRDSLDPDVFGPRPALSSRPAPRRAGGTDGDDLPALIDSELSGW